MRFRLNSIMFLIELINQVERKFKIKKILVSVGILMRISSQK